MDYFEYSALSKAPNDSRIQKDTVSWCWKVPAFISPWLILAGYFAAPLALERGDDRPRVNRTALIILGSTLVVSGYVVSMVLCFKLRRRFLLESLFLPCFASSLLSALNVVFNVLSRDLLPLDSLATLVIGVSSISTVIYSFAAIITYWKVISSQRPARNTSSPDDSAAFVSEDEMQRRQLLKLLANNSDAANPNLVRSTFRIDLPENINPFRGREQDRYLVVPESAHEKYKN
ncbi:hypothetical protein DTO166G4_111 [Paecilomyces variotii]|uniref:Uncharacterized protein n=1 Tax=Byssochlamys spectabilis TaxID=264951 RepID=A0A443HW67_BYSSP|nr:hypothetical protein C8Q69DRAFT_227564 [Paecilomyces variotii]KAJ9193856.1 hypothetical protein DTO164E3_7614 [Paecilomyces variotii]KAJ9194848.1 hypothetical protein DTO032I3_7178 [Paecilomyces variotii]KAJ9218245.1 hypothetical protein DTO166G4_111 [Paecilomyces variotii]KAJ9239795.1 hypothetical protein DTO166G5_2062 [Paecilomyces variotii]KAJ9244739.1 hypothetical protein DTO169E5_1560 [Paecilomyces variotii]